MSWLSNVSSIFAKDRVRSLPARSRRKRFRDNQIGCWNGLEHLESRLVLANPVAPILVSQVGSALTITYNQSVTTDQHVVIDIEDFFPAIGVTTTRVNVYASTNPAANPQALLAHQFEF